MIHNSAVIGGMKVLFFCAMTTRWDSVWAASN
jgi:hypothetical protein